MRIHKQGGRRIQAGLFARVLRKMSHCPIFVERSGRNPYTDPFFSGSSSSTTHLDDEVDELMLEHLLRVEVGDEEANVVALWLEGVVCQRSVVWPRV